MIQAWNARSLRFAISLGFIDVSEFMSTRHPQQVRYRVLVKRMTESPRASGARRVASGCAATDSSSVSSSSQRGSRRDPGAHIDSVQVPFALPASPRRGTAAGPDGAVDRGRVVILAEHRWAAVPADERPLPSVDKYDILLGRETS